MLKKIISSKINLTYQCSLAVRRQLATTQEIINVTSQNSIESQPNYSNIKSVFESYGFKNKDICDMLQNNNHLLTKSAGQLNHSIEFWRGFQFNERNFQELLIEQPQFLEISNHQTIANKIALLKSLVYTPKGVWHLLINSPNIIHINDASINRYFEYMEEKMRLQTPEIVKSKVFSKSLDTLKCRHTFLERLGLFKAKSPKSDPNEPTKNPRLYQIIDTTDKEFCRKICGVSLMEFETFAQLLSQEQQSSSYDEEDDVDEDFK